MTSTVSLKRGYGKYALAVLLSATVLGAGVDTASAAKQAKGADLAVADGPVKIPAERGLPKTLAPSEGSGKMADAAGVDTREKAFKDVAPAPAPVLESILLPDDRFRINPTTTYPYRATVRITSSVGQCTGWMISRDTVATAGHCVYNGAWATGVTVAPGQNGTLQPYGTCGARRLHSVLGWTRDRSSDYDYAAIKLNCTIGNTVGWYGMRWTTASLNGVLSRNNGYGSDKAGQLWASVGTVKSSFARRLHYTNDTYFGNSGGPVYDYVNGAGPYGIAVHTNGTADGATNSGTRIAEPVFNNYVAWAAAA
jgi:glutamyl endopeptidase